MPPVQSPMLPSMAEVVVELRKLMEIGLPIGAMNLASYLKGMISVTCLGRLGRLELAGGALAVGLTNITGYSVLSGLAMGMEPVCSQAFGSGNLPLVSRALRRTVAMLLLASLPVSILWANLRPVLLLLRQDPEVARVAALYCRFAAPDLLAGSVLYPVRVYLRCRGTVLPLMWCSSVAVLLHLPATLLLCFTLRLGVPGVAVASWLTNLNALLLLLLYMARFDHRSHGEGDDDGRCGGPHHDPLLAFLFDAKEWLSLVRLSLPSCLGVCLEWWWYELMTLAAGYLPDPHVGLGAAAIAIQATSLLYTFPATLGASVSARVGNELGAGRWHRARLAAAAAMALSGVSSLGSLLFATLGRRRWARMFTGDPGVARTAAAALPVVGVCELANCPQTTGCGVLRGSARPAAGAAINFCAFYLVGAPVAAVLAFAMGLGFAGFVYGLLAAQVACATAVVAVVWRTDWKREALRARDLVRVVGGGGELAVVEKEVENEEGGVEGEEGDGLLEEPVVVEV